MIKELLSRFSHQRNRFDEIDTEQKMNRLVAQRQKGSNERELERYMEEDRQEQIKVALTKFRKKKSDDLFHNNFLLKNEKIFDHKNTVMQKESMLGGKSMFLNKGNFMGGSKL